MLQLCKSDRNGEYYMRMVLRNGRETWRTSETYKRKAGAINAAYSAAKEFGTEWDGVYADRTHGEKESKLFVHHPDMELG